MHGSNAAGILRVICVGLRELDEMEPTILDLANVISNNAVILDEHFRRHNLAQPSFSEDAPNHGSFTDPKIAHAQQALISTAWELLHLAIGPVQAVRSLTSDVRTVQITLRCR